MNSLILISPSLARGFQPILSGHIKFVAIDITDLSLLSCRASKLDFYGGRDAHPQDFQ